MKNEIKIKHVPKDAYDTLEPINSLLKIFSLTTLSRRNGRLKITYSWPKRICAIATLIIATILASLIKFIKHFKDYTKNNNKIDVKFTDALLISNFIKFVQYIVDLHYVFKFGGHTNLKYFKLYDQIDEILGMTYNNIIKSKVSKATVSVCLIIVVCSVLAFAAWSMFSYYAGHMVHCMDYILFFVNTLTIIDMCANVILIEYRLKTVGDVLHDLYCAATTSLPAVNVVEDRHWLYYSKDKAPTSKNMRTSKCLGKIHLNNILWLNKCYLLIIEQATYINETFGARVSKIEM